MIRKVLLKSWRTHLNNELEFHEGVNCLLGSMGSGKTSVLEAICFALYGKTPSLSSKKLNLGDMIMQFPTRKHEAEVRIWLEVDGKTYEITRKLSSSKGTYHSEIRENGRLLAAPQTQEVTKVVEKIIGIDYDTFVQIVYGEQNRMDLFLSLRPGERKKRMDEILKLERIEKARANLTTLINSLQREVRGKESMLAQWKAELDGVDVDAIRREIEERERELEALEKEINSISDRLGEKENLLMKLKVRKREAEAIKHEIALVRGKVENLMAEIENSGLKDRVESSSMEEISKELESHRNRLAEIYELEKELERASSTASMLKKEIEKDGNELRRLLAEIENAPSLEEIEKDITELEMKDRDLLEKISKLKAMIEKEKETLEALKGAESSCPVCEAKLTEEKKAEITRKKEARIEECRREIGNLNVERKNIMEKMSELKTMRMEAIKIRSKKDAANRLSVRINENEQLLKKMDERVRELQNKLAKTDKSELEEKIKTLEKLLELVKKRDEALSLQKRMEELSKRLSELDVDDLAIESLEKEVVELTSRKAQITGRVEGLKLTIQEKKNRLQEIEERLKRLKEVEKEVDELKLTRSMLIRLQDVLVKSQVEIREEFIAALNYQMSRMWEVLYPYEDYQDIRLFVEGDSYTLKLLNAEGVWVDADTFVSGGERMTAALTLRLSLANLLAPSFRVIILDEPTHNLDCKAVEELGRTLREKAIEVLKQVILITHDELLAETAAEHLYKFERGEGKKDITRVIRVY